MRRAGRWFPALASAVLMVSWLSACRDAPRLATDAPADPLRLLVADGQAFPRPEGPWELNLPADHGAHPDFRAEIWSVSGSLADRAGRRFGFQLLVLRLALTPMARPRDSAWATNQIYVAQFVLADGTEGAFLAEERASRDALGLSGASREPARVWVEDWSLEEDGPDALRLSAVAPGRSLALVLRPSKPPLEQGGIDFPGFDAEAAFRFYAMPRLEVAGELKLEGEPRMVTGNAWFDHGWGDVALPTGEVALDRFILQLGDGRDLLCLRLHRRDGTGTPVPSCLLVAADASTTAFRRRDIRLEPMGDWQSPLAEGVYPVHWQLAIPERGMELSITPLVQGQELEVPVRAWRGAVSIDGHDREGVVQGFGLLELTGYRQSP